jgi:ferredoxin/flavodoxin---NADP+ reductase
MCKRALMGMHSSDVLIVGAGPAGLYAAYYAGFRGWSVTIVDALPEIGGQVSAMYPEKAIFDIAGFPMILGRDLIDGLLRQASASSPTILLDRQATGIDTSSDEHVVVSCDDGSLINAKAVIITGGLGAFRPRPLPAAAGWEDRGLVHFVPRLADHAGKDVVIVGGGDSAFDWALSLHPIARSVTLVHRRPAFRAHAATVEQVRELGIEILTPYEVTQVADDDGGATGPLARVTITSKDGQARDLPAQVMVAALGFIADISALDGWGLDIHQRHITVDTSMRTALPRVFAAGDIATYEGKVPLISVGFGEAALAVNNAAQWVQPGSSVFPGHSSGGSAD